MTIENSLERIATSLEVIVKAIQTENGCICANSEPVAETPKKKAAPKKAPKVEEPAPVVEAEVVEEVEAEDDARKIVPQLHQHRLVQPIFRVDIRQHLWGQGAFLGEGATRSHVHQQEGCDDQQKQRRNRNGDASKDEAKHACLFLRGGRPKKGRP